MKKCWFPALAAHRKLMIWNLLSPEKLQKKNGMDKGNNLAFHLIQSFKLGEINAETAHRLGQQFADEVLKI